MSPAHHSTVLDGQLTLYETQAEAWKQDHETAMACYELQTILGFGLHIFNSIRVAEDAWAEAVRSGTKANRREDAQQIRDWFAAWIKPCDDLEKDIKQQQSAGYAVDHAEEFQRSCLYARSMLNFSLDGLYAKDAGAGRKSMGEMRDALRDRLQQKSR